jgi:vancomycin permeability regulator SanA
MKRILIVGIIVVGIILLLVPPLTIQQSKQQIKTIETVSTHNVAIVFGAGIVGDYPSDVLKDRLKTVAELYTNERIDYILVSGDNRFENYSEPDVMTDYLVHNLSIPEEIIHQDFAGRRTYDTCMRAHELWGIEEAILVTQEFHLPRAIWTCEQLGITSTGISASLQAYRDDERNIIREWLARYKAFIDVHIWTPKYVSGEVEQDLDP